MIFYKIGSKNIPEYIKKIFIKDNIIINEISNIHTIDLYSDAVISLVSNPNFIKEKTHLILEKPKYGIIDLYGNKSKDTIILNQFEKYNIPDYDFYLKNLTSEDGIYENNILNAKFDFLIGYLKLFEISYSITNGTNNHITNIIKKHII